MKILQPSKRSKRSSKSADGAGVSTKPERFADTGSANKPTNAKRMRNSSEASFGMLHGAYSESPVDTSGKALSSKKRRKSKSAKTSLGNKYAEDLDVIEKDSEFDFDTSKLEAMPRLDEANSVQLLEGKKRRRSELETSVSTEPLELIVDPAKKEFNELFARGVRLLAMREHSVKEITNKLFDKSEASDTIYAVVDELLEKKYLSDERFAESYIRARGNRGFGPVKIKAELKQKGVSSSLIQDYLDEGAALWFDNAASQYHKKYGDTDSCDRASS